MKTSKLVAAVIASALLVSPSFAESPLPAGKPAGSHEAALLGFSALTVVFVAGFAAILITAAAGGFSASTKTSTNSSVTTTGTGG